MNDGAVMIAISQGKYPNKPKDEDMVERGMVESMWSLMRTCWSYEANARPEMWKVSQIG